MRRIFAPGAVLAVLALGACGPPAPIPLLERTDSPAATAPTAPTAPTANPPSAMPARVPDVLGDSAREAEAALRAAGLRPDVVSDVHQSCDSATSGTVTATRPAPGSPTGRRGEVEVVVPMPRTTCDVPPDLREIGIQLVDFALDVGPAPEVAEQVPLLLGHRRVGTLTPATAGDPSAWAGCPSGAAGAFARTCPVSALTLITDNARNGTPDDFRTTPSPDIGARTLPARPAELDGLRLLNLTVLPEQDTLASGGSTEVYVDQAGRVAAVDVVPREP